MHKMTSHCTQSTRTKHTHTRAAQLLVRFELDREVGSGADGRSQN